MEVDFPKLKRLAEDFSYWRNRYRDTLFDAGHMTQNSYESAKETLLDELLKSLPGILSLLQVVERNKV